MEVPVISNCPMPHSRRRKRTAAGFASAVCPITAATITTDGNGLDAGELKIPTADGEEMPVYRAMPSKGKSFPVVRGSWPGG